MSGKVETQADTFRILAQQFGAEHILQKPFELKELLAAVEQSLADRSKNQDSEYSS
jgi:DNA-binding response OmpR family regulator